MAEYRTLVEEEDLEIVTLRKPKLRIEIDTDKLGLNDVLFLMELRKDTMENDQVLKQFMPIIERCLVGMTIAELPLRALNTVFTTIVQGLEGIGTKTKNSSGTSPQVSGQPETAAQ